MPSQNQVFLTGHLARDAEFRNLPSGTDVASLTICHDKKWKDRNGEQQKKTSFIDIEVMGRSAEIIGKRNEERGEFVKGDLVQVDGGELEQDRWETSDGNKRSKLKVKAFRVNFLRHAHGEGAPEDRQPQAGGQHRQGQAQNTDPEDDGDVIPF